VAVALVLLFALGGWVMAELHRAVLWSRVGVEDKAKIIQTVVVAIFLGMAAFYAATVWMHYPEMVGYLSCSVAAYGGARLMNALVDGLIETIRKAIGKANPSRD
jgi:hypothetical protein